MAGAADVVDGNGRFEFTDLPAGRFTISVAKGGFVTTTVPGQPAGKSRRDRPVRHGQRYDRGELRLPRGGVITGRVLDAFGDPVMEASVSAFRAEYINPGVRRLSASRPVQTNDLGDFRIYGVAPGKYYVGASLRPLPSAESGNAPPRMVPSTEGVATTFFPGTAPRPMPGCSPSKRGRRPPASTSSCSRYGWRASRAASWIRAGGPART